MYITKVQLCFLIFMIGCVLTSADDVYFNNCYEKERSSCFKICDQLGAEANSLWDDWSTLVLGNKVMRRRIYSPCEDRCVANAHYSCTEKTWEIGGDAVKMFGRWPMKRVLIFEEFASMLMSGIGTIVIFNVYKHYNKKIRFAKNIAIDTKAYGFESLYSFYYFWMIFTFAAATLFHTKDTPLTEKMDYYSAFLGVFFGLYASTMRICWIKDKWARILIGIPFIAFAAYHLYYMTFVSFDYGYNQTVIIVIGVCHSLMWIIWCYINRDKPYIKYNLMTQATMWIMSSFEIFDRPPFFGYIDMHSIWHLAVTVVAVMWSNFLISDALYYINKKRID